MNNKLLNTLIIATLSLFMVGCGGEDSKGDEPISPASPNPSQIPEESNPMVGYWLEEEEKVDAVKFNDDNTYTWYEGDGKIDDTENGIYYYQSIGANNYLAMASIGDDDASLYYVIDATGSRLTIVEIAEISNQLSNPKQPKVEELKSICLKLMLSSKPTYDSSKTIRLSSISEEKFKDWAGYNGKVLVTPASVELGYSKGSEAVVTVSSTSKWKATKYPEWLRISQTSGEDNDKITITALSDNKQKNDLTGEIWIECGSGTAKIAVTQKADASYNRYYSFTTGAIKSR